VFDTLGVMFAIKYRHPPDTQRWRILEPSAFDFESSQINCCGLIAIDHSTLHPVVIVLPPRATEKWISLRGIDFRLSYVELTTSRPPKGQAGVNVTTRVSQLSEPRLERQAAVSENALRCFLPWHLRPAWWDGKTPAELPAVEDCWRSVGWLAARSVARSSNSVAGPAQQKLLAGLHSLASLVGASLPHIDHPGKSA